MILEEKWKDIEGYEGYYQVSSLGRIKRIPIRINDNSAVPSRVFKERILKGLISNKGYKYTSLSKHGKVRRVAHHRMVAQSFLENPLLLSEVNHINEDKLDNSIFNLEWCTHLYNIRFGTGMSRKSITQTGKPNYKNRGEGCASSKLKNEQVISIFNDSSLYKDISKIYNIGIAAISNIKNKKTWKHLL